MMKSSTDFGQLVKILLRISAFAIAFVTISWQLRTHTNVHDIERAWPEFHLKWQHACSEEQKVNAVILGSSVVRHHFDPAVLNQETDFTWYNLGLSASFPPESYAITEALLRSAEAEQIDLLVLDMLPLEPSHIENAGSLRRSRSVDGVTMKDLMKVQASDRAGLSVLLVSALTHLVDGWRFPDLSTHLDNASDTINKGFLALDTNDVRTDALKYSRRSFLDNPNAILESINAESTDFDFRNSGKAENPSIGWICPEAEISWHMKRMGELISLAEKREITLVFSFQKLWTTNGCLFFEARTEWGEDHVIQLMGNSDTASMTKRQHWYDQAHLTGSGAALISAQLADKINRR